RVALTHRHVSARLAQRVRAAFDLQSANDAPTVKMLVVKAQVTLGAQPVDRFLYSIGIGKIAVVVVEANILGADLGKRWELLAAVFYHARTAARHRQQSEPAVVMLNAERRLSGWIRVGNLIWRPLNVARRRPRRNQPIVTRVVASR